LGAAPDAGRACAIGASCPPQLLELVGYDGPGRLVALCCSPFGDGLMLCDGTLTAPGNWRGWLCFCEHPLVRVWLTWTWTTKPMSRSSNSCVA